MLNTPRNASCALLRLHLARSRVFPSQAAGVRTLFRYSRACVLEAPPAPNLESAQRDRYTGLQISSQTVVEQEARPTGCLWFPFGGKGDHQKVLTMNDEYKFKVHRDGVQ